MYPAAQLAAKNPTLLAGEVVYEADTGRCKIGDGTSPWNSLPYGGGTVSSGLIYSPLIPSKDNPVTVDGGKAYWSALGPLEISDVGVFTDAADHAILTVPGGVTITFGSNFRLMTGVPELGGVFGQFKVYVIQRVQIAKNTYIYTVAGALFG